MHPGPSTYPSAAALVIGSGGVRVTGGGRFDGVIYALRREKATAGGADVRIQDGSTVRGAVFIDDNESLAPKHGEILVEPAGCTVLCDVLSSLLGSLNGSLPAVEYDESVVRGVSNFDTPPWSQARSGLYLRALMRRLRCRSVIQAGAAYSQEAEHTLLATLLAAAAAPVAQRHGHGAAARRRRSASRTSFFPDPHGQRALDLPAQRIARPTRSRLGAARTFDSGTIAAMRTGSITFRGRTRTRSSASCIHMSTLGSCGSRRTAAVLYAASRSASSSRRPARRRNACSSSLRVSGCVMPSSRLVSRMPTGPPPPFTP